MSFAPRCQTVVDPSCPAVCPSASARDDYRKESYVTRYRNIHKKILIVEEIIAK